VRSQRFIGVGVEFSSGRSLEVVTEYFQGVLGGPEADPVSVAGDTELLDLRVFTVGEGDVDEADGLGGVGAGGDGRAGDAGDA
jgi:hypothetical protein